MTQPPKDYGPMPESRYPKECRQAMINRGDDAIPRSCDICMHGPCVRSDGSHAEGLATVPYDGYVATLREGEVMIDGEVLTLNQFSDLLTVYAIHAVQSVNNLGDKESIDNLTKASADIERAYQSALVKIQLLNSKINKS